MSAQLIHTELRVTVLFVKVLLIIKDLGKFLQLFKSAVEKNCSIYNLCDYVKHMTFDY